MDYGWHQVAFDRELGPGLTQLATLRPLFALRTRKGIRVFDAACPHRAANLGVVGRPDIDAIVCGFHGKRIGLGAPCSEEGFFVRERTTLVVSGLVFVLLDGRDNGLRSTLEELDRTHYFVDGYTMTAHVTPELVVENGLDQTHFGPVHDIRNDPKFTMQPSLEGEFVVGGSFTMPVSPWQKQVAEVGLISVPYTARVFSAGVVVSHLGGADPYCVITCATSARDCSTVIRLSVAVRPDADGKPPSQERCEYLIRQTRSGLTNDVVIWESLVGDPVPSGGADDAILRKFRDFLVGMRSGVACTS
jgi:hypothetical protein